MMFMRRVIPIVDRSKKCDLAGIRDLVGTGWKCTALCTWILY
jgi:hypothetical protein